MRDLGLTTDEAIERLNAGVPDEGSQCDREDG
jgi:hypothetical protein